MWDAGGTEWKARPLRQKGSSRRLPDRLCFNHVVYHLQAPARSPNSVLSGNQGAAFGSPRLFSA
jgi:hypothetical protein